MNYRSWSIAAAPLAIMGALLACKRPAPSKGTSESSSSPSTSSAQPTDQQLEESLQRVLSEYASNEIRADGEFKGRVIATAGVIRDMRKDALGSIHVRFEDAEPRPGQPQAECLPSKSEEAIVSSLAKGGVAGFRGRVRGLILGTVLFSDCEIWTEETGR